MSDTNHASEHPTVRKYITIFIWLAVLTGVELLVVQPFMGLPKAGVVLSLIALAVIKAALVAMYFMHLKMDPRRLSITLVAPVAALMVLLTILAYENTKSYHLPDMDGSKLAVPAEGAQHEGAAHGSAPAEAHSAPAAEPAK